MAEIKLNNLTKHWGDIVGVDVEEGGAGTYRFDDVLPAGGAVGVDEVDSGLDGDVGEYRCASADTTPGEGNCQGHEAPSVAIRGIDRLSPRM